MTDRGTEPGVLRVGRPGGDSHGWWHIEVRSGWKTYAVTLCSLEVPENVIERDADRGKAECRRCLAIDAELQAAEPAAPGTARPAARNDSPARDEAAEPKTDGRQGLF